MRRVAILRRSPLRRRTQITTRPKRITPSDARMAWKEPHAGWCQCGCSRFALHLQRHHVIYEQHVRAEHGDIWDLANSMLLHPDCHAAHHSGQRRIHLDVLPDAALSFACDLLGEDRAALYVARYYPPARRPA